MVIGYSAFLILCLVTIFPFAVGLGYREFGEPCEPPKPIIVDDGRGTYGGGQYLNSVSGRPYPDVPYGQTPGQQYQGQQYQGQQYQQQGQQYQPQQGQQGQPYQQGQQRYDQDAFFRDSNETRQCRSEKGLRCDTYTRTCKCFELAGASWVHERERCEFRLLGTFCSPHVAEYAHHCTEYAECTCNWQHWDRRRWYPCDRPPTMDHHTLPGPHEHDTNNGKCLCMPGYRAYEDNSGCWYSAATLPSISVFLIIVPWLHLIHSAFSGINAS